MLPKPKCTGAGPLSRKCSRSAGGCQPGGCKCHWDVALGGNFHTTMSYAGLDYEVGVLRCLPVLFQRGLGRGLKHMTDRSNKAQSVAAFQDGSNLRLIEQALHIKAHRPCDHP